MTNWHNRALGLIVCVFTGAASSFAGSTTDTSDPIRFREEIQPILTKAGCNQGACHGAQYGKGGFKLSLRGFDDAADYAEIVKSAKSRRVLLTDAAASLLLTKPTLDVPHKGGKRLEKDSWAYETLLKWVDAGAPGPPAKPPALEKLIITPMETVAQIGDEVQLDVKAVYSDGTEESVLHKAGFDSASPALASVTPEGLITAKGKGETGIMVRYMDRVSVSRVIVPFEKPKKTAEFPSEHFVDKLWLAKWHKLGLVPTTVCTDAEFFRRIHLDVLGTLPTPEEVRAFLADASPDKRSKAIDTVLNRPEYVDYWSYKWGDLLRNNRDQVGEKGMWSFHNWLRAAFRENRRMDVFAQDIITAVGSANQVGPANFFQIGKTPVDWAENCTQVFLGVRVQCAKCHHHPFENISQAEYYGMAAFFSRVGTKQSQEFGIYGRDTIIFVRDSGEIRLPRTGEVIKPSPPGSGPIEDPVDPRRALARWLTDSKNPAFARNIANRYWGYLFGRGLIDPVDDIRVTNPPSCEEVLDALAKDFIEHQYDVKHLLRTLMRSRTYQLSSIGLPESAIDADNKYFTRQGIKRMTAEQLLDAIDYACGTREKFPQLPAGFRAISLPDTAVVSNFLDNFGRPKREVSCECERSNTPNMTQALELMTGGMLNRKVGDGKGRVAQLVETKVKPEEAIDTLYLCTVSRLPAPEERKVALELATTAPSWKEGLEDILWTLLNTREFQFNH